MFEHFNITGEILALKMFSWKVSVSFTPKEVAYFTFHALHVHVFYARD